MAEFLPAIDAPGGVYRERAIEPARAAGIEVIYTVIESLTQDGRDRTGSQDFAPAPSERLMGGAGNPGRGPGRR